MDKNPFLKRLMKEEAQEVVHSSVYAAAQGNNMGVASTESFAERRRIDNNRQMVRGYGDSKIMSERANGAPRAKEYEPAEYDAEARLSRARMTAAKQYRDAQQFDKVSGLNGEQTTGTGVGRISSARADKGQFRQGPARPPARKNPGIFR